MTERLIIRRPDDWHVHLRDGAMLRAVAPFTARQFARAIVMPNLSPPVTDVAMAEAYRHFYEGELRGTFDYIHDELWGEMVFRAALPAAEATRYTPDAYEWKAL